jgi:hypothetical protein
LPAGEVFRPLRERDKKKQKISLLDATRLPPGTGRARNFLIHNLSSEEQAALHLFAMPKLKAAPLQRLLACQLWLILPA